MWGKNKVGELGLEGMSVFAQVYTYIFSRLRRLRRLMA
jgi:hypothetical protein